MVHKMPALPHAMQDKTLRRDVRFSSSLVVIGLSFSGDKEKTSGTADLFTHLIGA
jgi:hypothetical protein